MPATNAATRRSPGREKQMMHHFLVSTIFVLRVTRSQSASLPGSNVSICAEESPILGSDRGEKAIPTIVLRKHLQQWPAPHFCACAALPGTATTYIRLSASPGSKQVEEANPSGFLGADPRRPSGSDWPHQTCQVSNSCWLDGDRHGWANRVCQLLGSPPKEAVDHEPSPRGPVHAIRTHAIDLATRLFFVSCAQSDSHPARCFESSKAFLGKREEHLSARGRAG
ncbi:hypothetical protein BDW62DRAFT_58423 [Aspergillus aurantiobrunneus]